MGNTNNRPGQGGRGDSSTNERGVKKCVTLKNHASIRAESIKLKRADDGSDQHELDLVFDSNYECMITVYLCATEIRNAQATPLFYYTDAQRFGAPSAFKFSSGLKQKLPKGVCRLGLSQYPAGDLTHYRDDFYPIVIAIESIFPPNYKGRARKSIQFTLGALAADSEGSYRFKLLKQKLLYNRTIFELTDMYGKESGVSAPSDETQRMCVICFETVKDTVVLPCRHLCLCKGCSQIVRMQSNTCPICRCAIESFLHIKFKDGASGNQQQQQQEEQAVGAAEQHL